MRRINILWAALAVLSLAGTASCDDPTKDVNGEKISLVRIDLPESEGRFSFYFVDAETGEPVEGKKIQADFYGDQGGKLIDINGHYIPTNTISAGLLNANLDPNLTITESSPATFTINGFSTDNILILPQEIKVTEPGDYGFYINTLNLGDMTKSVARATSNLPKVYDATGSAIEPISTFQSFFNDTYTIEAIFYTYKNNTFTVNETGYVLMDIRHNISSSLSINRSIFFLLKKKEAKDKPVSLSFKASQQCSFDVVVTNSGSTSGSRFSVTTGADGAGQCVVNIPVNGTIGVKLTPKGAYTLSQTQWSGISGKQTLTFNVTPNSTAHTYQLVGNFICPTSREIALAPSYSYQYKKKCDPDSKYAAGKLNKGQCTLLLEPNTEYTFRVDLGNGSIKTFDVTTNPNNINAFIKENADIITSYDMVQVNSTMWSINFTAKFKEICESVE